MRVLESMLHQSGNARLWRFTYLALFIFQRGGGFVELFLGVKLFEPHTRFGEDTDQSSLLKCLY